MRPEMSLNSSMYTITTKPMTQSQTTSNNTSQKDTVSRLSGITKGNPVVTGDTPQTKKFDPVADQDNRLMQMLELSLAIKDQKSDYDVLRKSFENDLKAGLDDNEENPKIRHSENPRVHVYLSKRRVYKYSDKLTAKRIKLEAQMADLKDEEAKEVRHGKADLTKETFTDVLGDFGQIFKGGTEDGFFSCDCYYGTWNESDNV